jgi:hypothetical protein
VVTCHNVNEFGGLWLAVTPTGQAAAARTGRRCRRQVKPDFPRGKPDSSRNTGGGCEVKEQRRARLEQFSRIGIFTGLCNERCTKRQPGQATVHHIAVLPSVVTDDNSRLD